LEHTISDYKGWLGLGELTEEEIACHIEVHFCEKTGIGVVHAGENETREALHLKVICR
jgi:hypothetical protein